jgi:crotonobetainyl-CoA hydratase
MSEAPLLRVSHGHVLVLTLNRPEAMNAINRELTEALGDAIEEAAEDEKVRAIVLTGAGERSFCAGIDLKAMAAGEEITPRSGPRAAWGFAGFVSHSIAKPTIAAVNGFALGGGTEIALAADLVVASSTAKFGLPEVTRGITAAAGGMFRLGRQVSKKVAMELLLTGAPVDADRALGLGLVNRVVAPDEVIGEALVLAETIAANAPLAVQATKRVADGIDGAECVGEAEDWDRSLREALAVKASEDAVEGRRAFIEKRNPVWSGR